MTKSNKKYINKLKLTEDSIGYDRRLEMVGDIIKNSTTLPSTLLLRDIDKSFKAWVETDLNVVHDNNDLPTFLLSSSQRFSEYSQTWQHTDNNQNILMNFKTIIRDNTPITSKNSTGVFNIPGDRFYLMKREERLDDNGTKYYVDYKMKQPYMIDLTYKVSLITNKYDLLNEFCELVNDKFKAVNTYIRPKGHYTSMILESITDDTEYNIDDRRFFTQTYTIKVSGYIIRKSNFIVEETPAMVFVALDSQFTNKKSEANMVVYDDLRTNINVTFSQDSLFSRFSINSKLNITEIKTENINKFTLYINNIEIDNDIFIDNLNGLDINNYSDIKIKIIKNYKNKSSKLELIGTSQN